MAGRTGVSAQAPQPASFSLAFRSGGGGALEKTDSHKSFGPIPASRPNQIRAENDLASLRRWTVNLGAQIQS